MKIVHVVQECKEREDKLSRPQSCFPSAPPPPLQEPITLENFHDSQLFLKQKQTAVFLLAACSTRRSENRHIVMWREQRRLITFLIHRCPMNAILSCLFMDVAKTNRISSFHQGKSENVNIGSFFFDVD